MEMMDMAADDTREEPVSYTHLSIDGKITDMAAIPAHIARGILQSSAMQRTIGTHKI